MEMMNRTEIIRGLERCRECLCDDCTLEGASHYPLDCVVQDHFVQEAVRLLKEQEPHVLTLDEAVDGSYVYYVEFQYHLDRGWVKCDFDRMYVDGKVAMLFLRNKTFYQQKEDYGRLWRLWSACPTYDQMKAVKWND